MDNPICYQTRYEDGVFIGINSADENPLDGSKVLPGGCVDIVPPNFSGGSQARWNNGQWVIENAPPRTVVRDSGVIGIIQTWDGEHLDTVEVLGPTITDQQQAGWSGKEWIVSDKPKLPDPPPAPVLTATEKLAAAGLTVAELKELLGIA